MKERTAKGFRPWETAALIALCAALCLGAWAQARQNGISGSLVRLHVVAASDEPEEQALKLRVRDAVLDCLAPSLEHVKTAEEAKAVLEAELENIARAATDAAEGRTVRVSLGRENYPARIYEGFTLPAGTYDSLRVVLGEGEGHNWWCVVFPPLCLSAAQAEPLRSAMGREDLALVTGEDGYTLRFRTVELWGELTAAVHRGG